jgi:hypothetical protein
MSIEKKIFEMEEGQATIISKTVPIKPIIVFKFIIEWLDRWRIELIAQRIRYKKITYLKSAETLWWPITLWLRQM